MNNNPRILQRMGGHLLPFPALVSHSLNFDLIALILFNVHQLVYFSCCTWWRPLAPSQPMSLMALLYSLGMGASKLALRSLIAYGGVL